MTTATEYLDAFNNALVNKDKPYLDTIMADNCTIHFTDLNETMTRQECLDWSKTDFCAGCEGYVIIQDTNDSIAGTHRAWVLVKMVTGTVIVSFLPKRRVVRLRTGTSTLDH